MRLTDIETTARAMLAASTLPTPGKRPTQTQARTCRDSFAERTVPWGWSQPQGRRRSASL